MRVDLVCDFVCRLLNHMDSKGATACTPTLREQDAGMTAQPWINPEEFNAGYIQRSLHLMPKGGDHEPWQYNMDYYTEKDQLPAADLDDGALVYSAGSTPMVVAG